MLAVAAMLLTAAFGCRNAYDGEDPQSSGKRPAQTDSPPDVSSAPPKIIFTPVESAAPGFYDGYTFRVLEKTDGADSLTADDAQDMIAKAEEERGAKISVMLSTDPVGDASKSIESGDLTFDAMNLPLTDLAVLLRSGYLENLAALGIDPQAAGAENSMAESLAVNGKYYIAFSDITPSSLKSTYALRCDVEAALSNEIYAIFGKDIRDAALAGELTLENVVLSVLVRGVCIGRPRRASRREGLFDGPPLCNRALPSGRKQVDRDRENLVIRLVVPEIVRAGVVPDRDIGLSLSLVGIGLHGRHGLESGL